MIQQIMDRKSIRRFRPDPVAREAIEDILQAGILAPSSKNRQPWRFVVAQGAAKEEALQAMERGPGAGTAGAALAQQYPAYQRGGAYPEDHEAGSGSHFCSQCPGSAVG